MKKNLILVVGILMLTIFLAGNTEINLKEYDKAAHIIAFFIVGFFFRDLRILALFLAIFFEVVQLFIPYRAFEWLDLLCNIAGLLLYIFCSSTYRKLNLKHSSSWS